MEGTVQKEENVSDTDASGSHDTFVAESSVASKNDTLKVDNDPTGIDYENTLSSVMERSKIDSNPTNLSREPIEIGSERLQMRNCPFFYIPDNTHKKKITQVQSKVGSLENIHHSAGGGDKKIFSQKVDVSSVTSRINSKANTYPAMLPVKSIRTPNLKANKAISRQDFKPAAQVCSKIGSLENLHHKPGGGVTKITTYRTPDYKHKISTKLDTSDPTPSVHRPRNDINELICDEVIHYQSRYRHRRPHSAPAKHQSHERPLHSNPHSESNITDNISIEQFSLGHGQNFHSDSLVTEFNSENTSGDNS